MLSCKSNNPCSDVACTLELRTVFISILNNEEEPVSLDEFQVIDINNNREITLPLTPQEFESAQQNGRYPLINDLGIGENETLEVRFTGLINNNEVVNEIYTINSDCCHISTVFGRIQVMLE